MKKIVSILFIASICSLTAFNASAQEYKHDVKQSKQIVFKVFVGGINIEEHSGTQLIITSDDNHKKPERANGLRSLYNSGASDNTDIGLQVTEEGGIIYITGASKQAEDTDYYFKIPKGVNLKIDYSSPYAKDDIHIKNFSGEVEAKALHEGIKLENVTGPLVLNFTHGDIEIDFATINQNSPISITNIHGIIDISLPSNTPAEVEMGAGFGEIFTNFDIKFSSPENKKGLAKVGGKQAIKGTINGGGVKIHLKTFHDNIYLRKK